MGQNMIEKGKIFMFSIQIVLTLILAPIYVNIFKFF